MVVQRDRPVLIWGWADPGEQVVVNFHDQQKKVRAGRDGKWNVSLTALSAGGPYEMRVKGRNSIVLTNVMVGDVWICSGQSNMEWQVRNSNNSIEEVANANYPLIRHFTVPKTVAAQPVDDVTGGEWMVCAPETVGDFTAVGYFFARQLVRELGIPIGLIHTSWGGTHSETWTSRKAFESSEEFRSMIERMPVLNLDSLARTRGVALTRRIEDMQGPFETDSEAIARWKTPDLDDSQWRMMTVPGYWEGQELGEFDGTVWLRKTIELTEKQIAADATLELSMIDDTDETYFNGTLVGRTGAYNERRSYKVPSSLLKVGKNTIVIRVVDTGGGGGVYGDAANIRLVTGSTVVALAGQWRYRVESISKNLTSVGPNSFPTLLFNGMIYPLLPLGIKGVIWYQGESNAGRAYQYRQAFPLMITDWRNHWNQGDFPFYFVQLASYGNNHGDSHSGSGWAELREAQAMTLALPNTGMAVTIDIGDPGDIHPRNKQDVGKRLAVIALNKTYGKKDVVYSGPTFESIKVEGKKVFVSFAHLGGGLMTPDRYGYLRGFEVAGSGQEFKYAKAFIVGDRVVVFNDEVDQPVAVRYGWADDASECNLFNRDGLPAAPFRSDHWPGVTENAKFSFQY